MCGPSRCGPVHAHPQCPTEEIPRASRSCTNDYTYHSYPRRDVRLNACFLLVLGTGLGPVLGVACVRQPVGLRFVPQGLDIISFPSVIVDVDVGTPPPGWSGSVYYSAITEYLCLEVGAAAGDHVPCVMVLALQGGEGRKAVGCWRC